jgi:hypothetical protein
MHLLEPTTSIKDAFVRTNTKHKGCSVGEPMHPLCLVLVLTNASFMLGVGSNKCILLSDMQIQI